MTFREALDVDEEPESIQSTGIKIISTFEFNQKFYTVILCT